MFSAKFILAGGFSVATAIVVRDNDDVIVKDELSQNEADASADPALRVETTTCSSTNCFPAYDASTNYGYTDFWLHKEKYFFILQGNSKLKFQFGCLLCKFES